MNDVANQDWLEHFKIQSGVDLDFVIGQSLGWPVGMERRSPPAFRRRVLAAALSYQLGLRSIDYVLKNHVEPDLYEGSEVSLGDETSDYLRNCAASLQEELKNLHTTTENLPFGVFGAEITLYRIPYALDMARMLSNRGLLLEVLPILRLCLEMMCWARVAFHIEDEDKVIDLKAQTCISQMKQNYRTVGRLYGYLSRFTHWGHVIHGRFIKLEKKQVSVLYTSVRYRAMSLALCLVALDVLVEVVKQIYGEEGNGLVLRVQGVLVNDATRKTHQYLSKIVEASGSADVREIQSLLH
jgi:hypothetical protein